MCQTIVAKSAACNKRWKELEKWKSWFNTVIKTGAQPAMTEWTPIQTDLMPHGISSSPKPLSVALKNANKNLLYCPRVYTHTVTPNPPFASVWLPTFKIQYLIAMSPLLIGISLKFEYLDIAIIQECHVKYINDKILVQSLWIQVEGKFSLLTSLAKFVLVTKSTWVRFSKTLRLQLNNISRVFCTFSLFWSLYILSSTSPHLSIHTQQSYTVFNSPNKKF